MTVMVMSIWIHRWDVVSFSFDQLCSSDLSHPGAPPTTPIKLLLPPLQPSCSSHFSNPDAPPTYSTQVETYIAYEMVKAIDLAVKSISFLNSKALGTKTLMSHTFLVSLLLHWKNRKIILHVYNFSKPFFVVINRISN